MPTNNFIKPDYIIRNYRSSDFDEFAQLYNLLEKAGSAGQFISPEDINEHLKQPGYSPADDLFLADINGEIVGYLDIKPEITIKRAICHCWVTPQQRRRGIGRELFKKALCRAGNIKAKIIHVEVAEDNVIASAFLSELDFKMIRQFLELRLDLTATELPNITVANIKCRPLRYDEVAKLTRIQNSAFNKHWGFNPNTEEEIIYRLHSHNYSQGDIILACDGDTIAGYCWTQMVCDGESAKQKEGRICMLGVTHSYRYQGIGKILLSAGLSRIKDNDATIARLIVDSENKIACELYKSFGFRQSGATIWYEKPVD
ncbi:GNAT family N-acetyltransferase [Chloroflexota bacterium]